MSFSETTPESKLKTESKGSLPEFFSLWFGDPSEIDKSDQKIPGQDTRAALELIEVLENPFRFVCLEKHADYYNKFFKEKGVTVEIQTAESFLKKCEEDDFLKIHAEKIRHIFNTYLSRGTKRDLVSIKNLISLLIAYQGAVVADSNVSPTTKKSFSIPEYKEFLLPHIGIGYDFWMIYSPPKSKEIKHIISSFLERWNEVEMYSANNEKIWNRLQARLMSDPIEEVMKERSTIDYPWIAVSPDVGMFMDMNNLPLRKMYQGSHKTKEMIGELLVHAYLGNFTEHKNLSWNNCKEAVKQSLVMNKPKAALFFLNKMHESKQNSVETYILEMIVNDSSSQVFLNYMHSIKNYLKENTTLQLFVDEMFDFTEMQDLIEYSPILNDYVSQEKRDEINEREDDVRQVDENISDQDNPEDVEEDFEKDFDQEDKNILDETTNEEMVYRTQIVELIEDQIQDLLSNKEYKINSDDQQLILGLVKSETISKNELLEKVSANLESKLSSQNFLKIKWLLDPLLSAHSYTASNLFRDEPSISDRDDLLETLNNLAKSSQTSDSKLFQKRPEVLEFLLDLREDERLFPKGPEDSSTLKKDAG